MFGFLRKLFGHQQNPPSTHKETDLERFYTNSEYALRIFEQLVSATDLPKRLLVIHGIGGVGKSTLLKMYGLSCYRHRIPGALVDSEESTSPVDMLAKWADDLNHDGVTLPNFQKTLNHYRTIGAKVEAEANKASRTSTQIAGTLGKVVAKTAVGMALSAIPIVGPVASALGGKAPRLLRTGCMAFSLNPMWNCILIQ